MKNILALLTLLIIGLATFVYVSRQRANLAQQKHSGEILSMQVGGSSSATSVSVPAPDFKLRILSEPDNSTVFIGDEKKGSTPFEMGIPLESKKLKLVLDGFEDYSRQIPAVRDAEGDLVWKIQLKKIPPKPAPPEIFKAMTLEPFTIQLKAVALAEFKPEMLTPFADLGAKICKVKLKDQFWVRLVVGPYETKPRALQALKNIKGEFAQAFLVQKQVCLP